MVTERHREPIRGKPSYARGQDERQEHRSERRRQSPFAPDPIAEPLFEIVEEENAIAIQHGHGEYGEDEHDARKDEEQKVPRRVRPVTLRSKRGELRLHAVNDCGGVTERARALVNSRQAPASGG